MISAAAGSVGSFAGQIAKIAGCRVVGIKVIEDVVEGFENLPDALIGLLHGKNRGKRMVRIG